MDFNVKKCKIMRITRKKQPFTSNFFLANSVLEEVDVFDQRFCNNYYRSALELGEKGLTSSH